jgi:hypothetical protein
MAVSQHTKELLDSYKLLFSPNTAVSQELLRSLEPEKLKDAYRGRMKQSHPDRAAILGLPESLLTMRSQNINRAYRLLSPLASNHTSPKSVYPRKPARRGVVADHFYQGSVPRTKLKFGIYLYYRRLVSWRTLIDALTWQRTSRPLIGQIAVNWDFLKLEDIDAIIRSSATHEVFGETALRLRLLSHYEIHALLGKQASYDCHIGRFFVEGRALTSNQIEKLIEEFRAHNLQCSRVR